MAKKPIEVETLTHDATRKNIPTAEFESLMRDQDKTPIQLAYERRRGEETESALERARAELADACAREQGVLARLRRREADWSAANRLDASSALVFDTA